MSSRPTSQEIREYQIEDIDGDSDSQTLLPKPEIPKDKYNIVHLIFFVLGAAQLLGWNGE